jgi:ATP-dependent helicase/nuclease subunit A
MTEMMSSILSQYKLTGNQNRAVTDRGVNIAVTAGAGSGKTRTLVGRYLSLLEDGLRPQQIAAVTFTEKAAREMRSRIQALIQKWLQGDLDENGHFDKLSAGRSFWQSVFAEMDAAPIGTIHSLCARILRTHPVEAALDPAFDVLDENRAAALQAQAVETTLVWAANDADAAILFPLLSEEGLRRTIAHLLQNRLEANAAFDAVEADPLAHWRRAAVERLGGFLDDAGVQTAVADLRALQTDGTLTRLASDKLAQTITDCLAVWTQLEEAEAVGDLAALLALLPQARQAMKPNLGRKSDWDDIDSPRQALADLRQQYDVGLSDLFSKPLDWTLEEGAAAALPHLHICFTEALRSYEAAKDQRRALDFDDLEARAMTLLENEPAVRAYWRTQLHAMLVDEFQDTNDRQRRIVYALTEFSKATRGQGDRATGQAHNYPTTRLPEHPTNLFVVGDAKQSIYRFRGADVTVFRRVQQDVADSGGKNVDLDLTFRAHAPLVAQLNALLSPVMAEVVDEKRPFAIPFSPLQAYQPEPRVGVAEPFVAFCLGVGETSRDGRLAAAQALARRLWQCRDEEKIGWGEMGLLCRASTSFPIYEDALEAAGIPFVTMAGRGFYNRPEVRDLLNALGAIANPWDDRSLAGLLRSPALALTDGAIYQLRRGDEDRERSLWAALHSDLSLLDTANADRARRAANIVGQLHDLAGRVSVARLLKQFLDLTFYNAILRRPLPGGRRGQGNERALGNVDKLLADAHASGLVSVGEFLEYVQTLRDVAAREGEAPVEIGEAVQLMTVHKAKGLEFPLVVIADAGRRGGGRPGALLLDERLGPVLKQKSDNDGRSLIYRLALQRDQEQDEAEARRLLYVAATRARQKLLVSGHIKLSTAQKTPGKLLPDGWLKQLGDVVGLGQQHVESPLWASCELALAALDGRSVGCTISPLIPEQPVCIEQLAVDSVVKTEMGEVAWPPPLLEPVTAVTEVEENERLSAREADPPPRVWRVVPTADQPRGPAWVVGTLFHEALRRWQFPDDAGFPDLMRLHAQEMGLTDAAEIADTIERAALLLRRFHQHNFFRQVVSARRYHEVPYTIEENGKAYSRLIDLLVEQNGRWLVVDFKTDWLRQEEITHSEKVEKYRQQVREYSAGVRSLLGAEAQGLLCFLDIDGRIWLEPVKER